MGQTVNLVTQFGAPTFTSLRTIGNTTLGNNLVVSGSITAQSLIVNSNSVYSGSTKFGEIITNTHQFTGSLFISGSTTVVGQYNGSGAGLTSIPNSALPNGTISGIALGSNLATLTIGTGLSGTSYNGSGAVTIACTITNTNQLTNGAGFITSAGTAAAISQTVTGTNSAELVRGNMADNDQFRILIGGTASNAGYVEIATADDGTEPIYVRQYTGVFSSLTRTATLLDGSGNTSFPGTVTSTFSGNLTGNVTGNCSGTSNNITAYTINQNVGSSNSPTFTGITVNGSITATGDIIAYYTSDKRHKNNIQPITNALSKVSKLNGVTWEWDNDVNEVIKQSPKTGLIAQEVEEVLPEVVKTRDDGFLALDYSKMMGLMVEAIKEQQAQIEELKSRL